MSMILSRSKILLLLALLPTLLHGQAPGIQWQYNYGGSMSDAAHCISPTSDGGYIIAGRTDSNDGDVSGLHGMRDIWVVKLRSDGSLEWQRCFGGSSNEENVAVIHETADGGYILGGTTSSFDGDVDCATPPAPRGWIVKISPIGQIEWQRCVGGSGYDHILAVVSISDGYMVSGSTSSSDGDGVGHQGSGDLLLLKLDLDGNTVWSRCYGGTKSDGGTHMLISSDGSFILVAGTSSNDGDLTGLNPFSIPPSPTVAGWFLKVDSAGEILWQTCVGGFSNDYLYRAQEATDGSIWAVGYTNSNDGDVTGNHGGGDAWIVRLDGSGVLMGNRCLGGTGGDRFWDLHFLPSGNVIAVGQTNSVDGDVSDPLGALDIWAVCLSPELEILWQRTLGGSANEIAEGITAASDGGVVISGYSQSLDGDLTNNNGMSDLWVVKLEPWDDTGLQPDNTIGPLQVFPNPVDDQLWVRHDALSLAGFPWTVTDLTGRTLLHGRFGAQQNMLSVEGLAPGAYHLLVGSGAQQVTARFIKQ